MSTPIQIPTGAPRPSPARNVGGATPIAARARRVFFDPLYKMTVVEDPSSFGPRSSIYKNKNQATETVVQSLVPLVDSLEFARMARLRQSALMYLTFPSATHTRYAHSLGCCYLGIQALERVRISDPYRQGSGQVLPLGQWLDNLGWKTEFLVSLLVHDVGHFAFSHMLERDEQLAQALDIRMRNGKFGVDHEEAGCQFILGKGWAYEAFGATLGSQSPPSPRLSDLLHIHGSKIDRQLVCYLVSGEKSYLSHLEENPRKQLQAEMVHSLTSGLLDLDRIDHYRRDSFFAGMSIDFNHEALMSGLTVVGRHPSDPDDRPDVSLRLDRGAVGHAFSLLHLRERLWDDCFLHPQTVVYESMARWCISQFFQDRVKALGEEQSRQYLFYTDDELLGEIARRGPAPAQRVAWRIANQRPFAALGAWDLKKKPSSQDVADAARKLAAQFPETGLLLYKTHPHLAKGAPDDSKWLEIDKLRDEDDTSLKECSRFHHQATYHKNLEQVRHRHVWFMSESADPKHHQALKEAIWNAGLWEKECLL